MSALVDDIDRALGIVTRPKAAVPQGAMRRSSPLSTGDSGREPPHA